MLKGEEGKVFAAIVTDVDERGIRFQLKRLPVAARMPANHAEPGDAIQVRLLSADTVRREVRFQLA